MLNSVSSTHDHSTDISASVSSIVEGPGEKPEQGDVPPLHDHSTDISASVSSIVEGPGEKPKQGDGPPIKSEVVFNSIFQSLRDEDLLRVKISSRAAFTTLKNTYRKAKVTESILPLNYLAQGMQGHVNQYRDAIASIQRLSPSYQAGPLVTVVARLEALGKKHWGMAFNEVLDMAYQLPLEHRTATLSKLLIWLYLYRVLAKKPSTVKDLDQILADFKGVDKPPMDTYGLPASAFKVSYPFDGILAAVKDWPAQDRKLLLSKLAEIVPMLPEQARTKAFDQVVAAVKSLPDRDCGASLHVLILDSDCLPRESWTHAFDEILGAIQGLSKEYRGAPLKTLVERCFGQLPEKSRKGAFDHCLKAAVGVPTEQLGAILLELASCARNLPQEIRTGAFCEVVPVTKDLPDRYRAGTLIEMVERFAGLLPSWRTGFSGQDLVNVEGLTTRERETFVIQLAEQRARDFQEVLTAAKGIGSLAVLENLFPLILELPKASQPEARKEIEEAIAQLRP